MTTSEFKTRFLPVLRNKGKTKEYNSKGYSKRWGNLSVHDKEFNPSEFNFIDIDGDVFHINYQSEVELTKTAPSGKMYGVIHGINLVPISLEYLKPFMDFQELEARVQELETVAQKSEPEYVWENLSTDPYFVASANVLTKKENSPVGELLQIAQSIGEFLEEKNKAYGESALKPLNILARIHPYGARIDEKLKRIENIDLKDEKSIKNAVADVIGGLILICKDKGWKDFKDQLE